MELGVVNDTIPLIVVHIPPLARRGAAANGCKLQITEYQIKGKLFITLVISRQSMDHSTDHLQHAREFQLQR